MRLATITPAITTPTSMIPTTTAPHGNAALRRTAFPGYHPCTLLSDAISLRTIRFGAAEVEGGAEVEPNPNPYPYPYPYP